MFLFEFIFVAGAGHFFRGVLLEFLAAFAGGHWDAAEAGGDPVCFEIWVVFAGFGVVGGFEALDKAAGTIFGGLVVVIARSTLIR